MIDIAAQHKAEVDKGDRFEFGKNWSRFLRTLTDSKIALAEASLRAFLGRDIAGKSFVDIGSGSGLFSLAARRLGARVRSFDYDSDSVACTRELKRRYFADDPDWVVEQGSALDADYLGRLGTFDIVYSWGVLHHTGSMWAALANVKPLVRVGGQLFIAIYNDQGEITDEWARIKARYNSLPGPAALAYALRVIAKEEGRSLRQSARSRNIRGWISSWRDYETLSVRGMNRWHDWIDWIGGHPYERATIEEIIDFYSPDGFRLTKIEDRTGGIGCNEFVFERIAPAGTFVENPIPGGSSMARQYGRRVVGPFEQAQEGWCGRISDATRPKGDGRFFLLRNDRLLGEVAVDEAGRLPVAGSEVAEAEVLNEPFYVVAAERRVVEQPFVHRGGHGWGIALDELAARADTGQQPRRSDVFLFEDGLQLLHPHAMHHEIMEAGGGRFSHWGSELLFSLTRVSENPNANKRTYTLLYLSRPLAREQSLSKSYGRRLDGPLEATQDGWTLSADLPAARSTWFLICDDVNVGPLRSIADGRHVVADGGVPRRTVETMEFYVVDAAEMPLPRPMSKRSERSWTVPLEGAVGPPDSTEFPRRSRVFAFQNGRQLPHPHAQHVHIDTLGTGRFSHWGEFLYFSTLNGEDPNESSQRMTLLIPSQEP